MTENPEAINQIKAIANQHQAYNVRVFGSIAKGAINIVT